MTERVRIAVAGAGAFGREHLERLGAMAGVEIAGIADIDLAAARQAAGRYGVPKADGDALEMIARLRPDGLVVATPGRTHLPIALAALAAGIPVLLEKPVGTDVAEAERLVAAEAGSSGFVLPGHVLRFSEHYRRLADIVLSGAIGPVLGFASRQHRDDGHAVRYTDVDPVLTTMVHDIDLAIWMTGAGASSVHALRRPPGVRRSDTLMLASGAAGAAWHLTSAWTFPGTETPPDRVEVVGGDGGVELELGSHIRQFGRTVRQIALAAIPDDPLAAELDCFVRCIRRGERPTAVTTQDARDGLAVAAAVIASLASGAVERVG